MSEGIPLWTESSFEVRCALPGSGAGKPSAVTISEGLLATSLKRFLQTMTGVLNEADMHESNYRIDSVELSLAVNASGGIELLGKLSAGSQASMKLTLTRKHSSE